MITIVREKAGDVRCGKSESNYSIRQLMDFVKDKVKDTSKMKSDIKKSLGLSTEYKESISLEIDEELWTHSLKCYIRVTIEDNLVTMIIVLFFSLFIIYQIRKFYKGMVFGRQVDRVYDSVVRDLRARRDEGDR